ncbi:methyltransferase TARBP1 [Lecanosticta acicola]|uniref:Methyltransferase TARBP1 n=1 Tax=Lecanosticta acicola TaxID=111012 RepID=A0AAI9E7E4_9PEZI|nr:methyltransferase TARBP1 [Lecanosticta acicola]
MATLRGQTARLVLGRVPENERVQVVREVVGALDEQSTNADIGFASTLLELHPDTGARTVLFAHLQTLIGRGEHAAVLSVLDLHPEMRQEAVARTSDAVSREVARLAVSPDKLFAVAMPVEPMAPLANGTQESDALDVNASIEEAANCLRFLIRVSVHLEARHAEMLLRSCVSLLGLKENQVCLLAQEACFALFGLPISFLDSHDALLWTRVRTLVAATDVFYKTLGFSIWLRWIASGRTIDRSILEQPEYWNAIVEGLRRGDSERRKASLQVLRASVEASLNDSALRTVIAADSQIQASSLTIQTHYARFCTVFETIALGSYLNQVMECEADLDYLTSQDYSVKAVWLYTLLEAALGQKMQESNRKFIGRWIMSSSLRSDDFDGFRTFFRGAFLPWLTTGHLFTSSLRRQNNIQRCEHGEKLSRYISRLLQSDVSHANAIVETILDSIFSRSGNNFAYATVYLIEGISQACHACPAIRMQNEQLERIGRITTWAGLPEVARDYMLARYWKLCQLLVERTEKDCSATIASSSCFWANLLERVAHLGPEASAHVDGNMASMALEASKRERSEQETIQKCEKLRMDLNRADPAALDVQRVEDTIDDIWSDLEYLEYPKSLLAVLPRLMPHQRLVQAALAKPEEHSKLEELMVSKTASLRELAQARSYMLSPLAATVRRVTLENPAAAPLFDIEDFVIRLSQNPPAPTLDAELEDATVPLLQALDERLIRLDYEYYFGPRESCGIASLLDLVSRLGTVNPPSSKKILDLLLNRWTRQKIPPSTVTPWKTALQLQVMLLCADQSLPTLSHLDAKALLKDFHYILAVEPLPRYRYLIEWTCARAYLHHPQLRPAVLEELRTKDHHSNPKFLASLMKLGVNIAKTDTSDEDFAYQLAAVFVPLAASSKVVIRHEAQWQIPILMDHAKVKGWKSVSEDAAFQALDEFIRSLGIFGDPPLERVIDKLDPVRDHNLTHLAEGPWWKLDHVEQPQTSHEDFVKLYESDKSLTFRLPPSCMPIGEPQPPPPQPKQQSQTEPVATTTKDTDHERKILQNIDNISRALGSGPGPTALQTKGAAYLSSTRTRHSNLLVIASLIENPYNLGGLSRVSEIFGTGTLYLQNPQVTSNKDFTNVSVSSHHHLPILPLAAKEIQNFVAGKKREEGYSVVGIEQTDRSVLVGEEGCVLPEKCILVIGSEREGIPAMILSECDLLVEIPQVGITRSLNVQTAAGIVLCEYAKQHRRGKK